jgi:predicted RNA-binding Zn-ribbon protein involved in translation (DUF1610 family)
VSVSPDERAHYGRSWAELRRHRLVVVASWLLCIPYFFAANALLPPPRSGAESAALLAGVVILVGVPLYRASRFRCPRCGGYFSRRRSALSRTLINTGCAKCGLKPGTTPDG